MTLNTDGGSRGNPGPGACSAILKDRNATIVGKASKFLGLCTNNEAEYQGLLLGLELAIKHNADDLEVLMDSELIVKQLNGKYRVKEPRLKPLFDKVKEMTQNFDAICFISIPRERNKEADTLVNTVLDQQMHV
jgi:ribonuclease HI